MLLNIYMQEIHIITVPLLMEEKYLFISLDLIKDLKNFKNPTQTTSQLLESSAPGRAVDLLQQVAAFLLGDGEKKLWSQVMIPAALWKSVWPVM